MVKTQNKLIAVFTALVWIFTAVLYLLPPVNVYADDTDPNGSCPFTVTGGTENIDYEYVPASGSDDFGILKILKDTPMTIKNTDPNTQIELNQILVESGVSANLTLGGLSLENAKGAALKIADDSTGNVTITLADGMRNELISYNDAACIEKNGKGADIGTLTIQCEHSGEAGHSCTESCGYLSANSYAGGAAIGSSRNNSAAKITINGGVINAYSLYASGIGGGNKGSTCTLDISVSDITINGGIIEARCTSSYSGDGSGIGSALNTNVSGICINGGKITVSSSFGAGIGGGYCGSASDITINGGNITATANKGGAAIGSGSDGNATDIIITDGNITADCTSWGAGIGTGYNGKATNVKITGSAVVAAHSAEGMAIGKGEHGKASENIVITAYSVNTSQDTSSLTDTVPTDGNGNNVYLLKTDYNQNNKTVYVDGTAYPITRHSDTEKCLYLYLKYDPSENTTHTVKIGENGAETKYIFSINKFVKENPDLYYNITATNSSDTITAGTDYTYTNETLTILSDKPMTISNKYADIATTDNIVIKSTANADITLAGVSIVSTNDKAAINIEDGANVKITLADNTVNTLTGAKSSAALQKIGWNGSLTITCRHSGESGHSCNESCGKLSATSYGDNAAIGSTGGNHAANITISGGNITAIGGSGAGIGCGSGSNSAGTPISSNINITGGNITAKGSDGAGIGGGHGGIANDITISGGVVNAEANGGAAAIGSGFGYNSKTGSNITISGGVVKASATGDSSAIGAGANGNYNKITISGGTVSSASSGRSTAINGSDIQITGGSVKGSVLSPTNGTDSVYLLKIANPDSSTVVIDGKSYTPVNHTAADSGDTNLYVYLSAASHTVKVGSQKEVTYGTVNNKFMPLPAEDDFVLKPPVNDIYDGTARTAVFKGGIVSVNAAVITVKKGIVGMGDITEVLYYNGSGQKIDQPVDAGTYTVKITVAAGDNYAASDHELEVGSYTIRKAIPTVTKPTATAITYGETLAASTLTAGWSWTDDTAKPDVQNSGYEAYTTVTDDNNYDYSNLDGYTYDEASHKLTTKVQVTVNKAVPTITEPTSSAIIYGQKLSDSVLSDTNWSWVSEDTVPDVQNSGYEAVITVDESNYDYTGISGYDSTAHTVTRTVAVTVNKADITADMLEFTAPANFVYDGHNKTAAVTAKTGLTGIGGITIRYYVNGTKVNDTSLPNTYTVKIDAAEGANFNSASDITDPSWTFTVTAAEQLMPPCDLTLTLESDGTYTAKIGFATGAEYKFNDGSWSENNTLSGLGHGKIVTAHIRMKATATHNASAEASDTKKTGHGIMEHHTAVPATCVDDGTIEYWSDAACGMLFTDADGIAEITVTDTVQPATGHSWSTSDWKTDQDHHWRECLNGCGEIKDKAAHIPGPAATEDAPQVCTECGYEIAPATGHIHTNHLVFVPAVSESCFTDGNTEYYECSCGKFFSDNQALNEITAEDFTIAAHHTVDPLAAWESDNDDNHYHICSVCSDKTDVTPHSYDSGVITTPATETTEGVKTYTCSVCNHTKTETVPKLSHTHSLSEDYSKDETGHWHTCSGCDEKVDFGAHIENSGTVTVQPTETSTGVMTYYCSVCGYEMRTETIPVIQPEHTHNYGMEWKSDSVSHWHECSCGDKTDIAQHISNGGTVTVQPTAYSTGLRTYSCTVCGYVIRTESIPATGSNYYPTYPTYPTNPTYPLISTPSVFTENLTVKAELDGSTATLGWDKVENADKYYVYQYKDGKYVKIRTTTDTSVMLKGLKNGETYKFLVRYSIGGKLSPMTYSYRITVKVYYKPIVKATSTENSVKLTWQAVPNAEKYAIYRYVDGKAVKLAETTKLSVIIKGLKPDTECKYIVSAYVDGEWTSMKKSDIVTIKTKAE